MNKPIVKISKSAHGTCDVIIYDMPNIKMVDWFSMMDVWGSRGYDRYGDDGLYFELPSFTYDIIEEIPFVRLNSVFIDKE